MRNNNSSFELETMEKKIVDKDNNWINASSVPVNMKNNLIVKESQSNLKGSFLDEDQIEQPRFGTMNRSNNIVYNSNTTSMKIPVNNNINITDEMTKNMNFLRNDIDSMVSSSYNNKSYMPEENENDKENMYENENPMRNKGKVVVVSHNNNNNQSQQIKNAEIKTKIVNETKEKKKTSVPTATLTTTNSKKNVVQPNKKK